MGKKKTPWFDGEVPPAYVGPYERRYSNGIFYCHWDGSDWHLGVKTPDKAIKMPTSFVARPWRGLAQEPKGEPK